MTEATTPKKYEACHSSAKQEWFTPPEIVRAVLQVFRGQIDCDPCARMQNDPNLPAEVAYTIDEDGLNQSWGGRVYMNPPYGPGVNQWFIKLAALLESNEVQEAVVLWKASTDTKAWATLISCSDRVCFIKGRLKFYDCVKKANCPAPFPSIICYAGRDVTRFSEIFSKFGQIWISPSASCRQSSLGGEPQ